MGGIEGYCRGASLASTAPEWEASHALKAPAKNLKTRPQGYAFRPEQIFDYSTIGVPD